MCEDLVESERLLALSAFVEVSIGGKEEWNPSVLRRKRLFLSPRHLVGCFSSLKVCIALTLTYLFLTRSSRTARRYFHHSETPREKRKTLMFRGVSKRRLHLGKLARQMRPHLKWQLSCLWPIRKDASSAERHIR